MVTWPERLMDAWRGTKVAVTPILPFRVTPHPPAPEQDWPQPAKTEPLEALAVSVTPVPLTSGVLVHVPGQLIPPIFEVTVPVPAPSFVTDRV